MSERMMREFAQDALALMGWAKLEELLRSAPLTRHPEELRIRNACWGEVASALRQGDSGSLAARKSPNRLQERVGRADQGSVRESCA